MLTEVPRKLKASHPQNGARAAFPTVLVAVPDQELRQSVVDNLSQDRCLVLEADTEDEAITVVIAHSRPIHVAVVGARMHSQGLQQRLRCYRPNLNVVCVTADWTRVRAAEHLPHVALSRVRELLGTGGTHRAVAAAG